MAASVHVASHSKLAVKNCVALNNMSMCISQVNKLIQRTACYEELVDEEDGADPTGDLVKSRHWRVQ